MITLPQGNNAVQCFPDNTLRYLLSRLRILSLSNGRWKYSFSKEMLTRPPPPNWYAQYGDEIFYLDLKLISHPLCLGSSSPRHHNPCESRSYIFNQMCTSQRLQSSQAKRHGDVSRNVFSFGVWLHLLTGYQLTPTLFMRMQTLPLGTIILGPRGHSAENNGVFLPYLCRHRASSAL